MSESDSRIDDLTIRVADDLDCERWNKYLFDSKDGTFCHQWQWRDILVNSFNVTPYYLCAERDDSIVGILPSVLMKSLMFGRYLISLPWLDYGGPVADNEEIARQLVNAASRIANENRCKFVEMRAVRLRLPELDERFDKFGFCLDLSAGEESVWKSLLAKARNQVRKAEKHDLTVEFGGEELLDNFYKIFARNMRDLGTPVWPKNLFEEIFKQLEGDCEIALVRMDKRPIAGGIIIHFRDYSAVPSASAYKEYLKYCPNNLMYWEIIKHCIERGSKTFDFGRSSEGAGTYRFKKQWVKEPVNQVWQYKLLTIDSLPKLNPTNPKFKTAISLWKKLPIPIANYIGPKIVTKLP